MLSVGGSYYLIEKLQQVLTRTIRILRRSIISIHITSILKNLHSFQIKFKINYIIYMNILKCLIYIQKLRDPYVPKRSKYGCCFKRNYKNSICLGKVFFCCSFYIVDHFIFRNTISSSLEEFEKIFNTNFQEQPINVT